MMGERPTESLWGIGRRTADKLAAAGIQRVRQLAEADTAELAARFGPRIGPHQRQLALGGGEAQVSGQPWVARSRSRETTFPADLTDRSVIEDQVAAMAGGLAREVVGQGRRVSHVGVKVRFASFFTQTKTGRLPAPTTDPRRSPRWRWSCSIASPSTDRCCCSASGSTSSRRVSGIRG